MRFVAGHTLCHGAMRWFYRIVAMTERLINLIHRTSIERFEEWQS
jgi:hypothetical protein